MPKYKTKKARTKERRRKATLQTVPRDKRILYRWARRGTDKDYAKLNSLANRKLLDAPSWVDVSTVKDLGKVGQQGMSQLIHKQQPERPADDQPDYWGGKYVHKLTDALSWLFTQAQGGKEAPVPWFGALPQYGLKPFKGESMTEVDEQYARVLSAGYKHVGKREAEALGWRRVPEFDSEYVSVWDNPDGHRYIVVRGTDFGRKQDVLHDINIARWGTTVDAVGHHLQDILDKTEPSRIVDVGAHSLGTVLALEAYKNNPDLQNRIHITRLYNPAYNPQLIASGQMPSVAKSFEKDPRVRYFINLGDVVSSGGFGTEGPKNVVYRTPLYNTVHYKHTGGGLDPYHNHVLRQWEGPYWDGHTEPEMPFSQRTMEERQRETGLPEERLRQLEQPFPFEVKTPAEISSDVQKRDAAHYVGVADRDFAAPEVFDYRDDEFLADLQQRFGVPGP